MSEDISQETIRLAASGDLTAFEQIYKTYFGFVANVVYRVTGVKEDTEEVVQEVFMSVYQNLKNFRFQSSLKTWVYRIAFNCALNYARKRSRHSGKCVEYTEDIHSPLGNPAEKIDQKEHDERVIASLLSLLTPDQRACIVLRSMEGLSYLEIAQVLNIPVNTVRSRIKRARETMLAARTKVVDNEL